MNGAFYVHKRNEWGAREERRGPIFDVGVYISLALNGGMKCHVTSSSAFSLKFEEIILTLCYNSDVK